MILLLLIPICKGLLAKKKKKNNWIPWLSSKSVQFFDAGILRGYMDLWASVPTSAKQYSTQICEIPALKILLYSDTSLLEDICIPSLYFINHDFFCFKECSYFIFDIFYLIVVEGNLSDLSVSTNAICQALEITLQRLFSELHWINSTRLFKHTCLLPTWSKWFDYLFTEIMTQGADYGFNFIWLMDLDFSCTLSNYAYPPTVQLPHWYVFFFVSVCLIWRVKMI